jgi:hypothetical protein
MQDMDECDNKNKRVALVRLFPGLAEDQLKAVEDTIDGYCTTVWRIYERLERERPGLIDELMRNRSIKGRVDSHQ